jgi:methyl-accepting chemotaxis protein PixJ
MLDHRLKEPIDNGKNGKIQESAFDANTIESAPDAKTPESKLSPAPQPKPKPVPFWQRPRQAWDNLGFRTKLALLLAGSAAIPVIIVTQALSNFAEERLLATYESSLKQELAVLHEAVEDVEKTYTAVAATIAKSVETAGIDVSKSTEVSARRAILAKLAEDPANDLIGQSFHIITDAQGRTVTQYIEILKDQDFSSYAPLPKDGALIEPEYRLVSLPTGIPLGDIPIVKNALSSGRNLAGAELLSTASLKRLGLDKQANIGIRKQKIEGLPTPKQPFPQGTYDVNQGKAGLVIMSVQPIQVNGRQVGTVMIGTLLNRNYALVDYIKKKYGIATATLFAKDWRVSTNVPYTDKTTRAIGTRVSREVAEKVLNRGETFIGEANIIGIDYLTGYSPLYDHQKQLNPSQAKPVGIAYIGEPKTQVQQLLSNLRLTGYGIGGSMLLLAGLVALPIAGSFARPLRRLSGFAQQVGAGKEGVRLEATERGDEIGVLSKELNQMAISIEANLIAQRQEAKRAQLLKDITVHISQSLNSEDVFNTAVQEIRLALQTDRVVVYSFNENWQGTVTAESVADGWPRALGAQIDDPCFADRYVERYREGRVQATENIYEAGFNECHIKQLEPFAVKANLVAPILQNKELLGLLIAHHCDSPRDWQQGEIDMFSQLATQVGLALDRANLLNQQKTAKETLQKRALELLMEVDPLTKGDLTIRANVTEDEIGTIADSYNSTIYSLRKIVTQVQAAAKQVTTTTSSSESSVQELSAEALRQTEEISSALARLQEMSNSIRAVATSAEQAEAAVQQATQTVEAGDAAMNRTVDGFMAIQTTVAETSQKVKRLGESSQKISKVVKLIGSFADQTNLLALNAAIEAARAGEEGRGFAVVADEVQSLALQSAQATAEIESLVTDIQNETTEVVAAMETGTEQVAEGTKLVDETRQSLNHMTAVSAHISELVEAIASAAVAQSQASELVTETMTDVAAIANQTSTGATQVSASFKELLTVAQELQASAGQFKVM